MRHFASALLAASSLFCLGTAHAANRPRYGGTLRVEMKTAPVSFDPADLAQSKSLEISNLSSLIFDTLMTLDNHGGLEPALAISWRPEPGNQRWQFKLRPAVKFQDGSPLTAEQVAAALRVANPDWKVLAAGDVLVIERDSPAPNLPAELAQNRNGIARRDGAKVLGTGPFLIDQWDPGKKLILTANNSYWAGRPFLDSIEITMGQDFRGQMISFDLSKADLIEVAPEQAHRAASENRNVQSSAPSELMALAFSHDPQSADEARLREALTLSIDRATLSNVLLQGGGEPAGTLLPNWMTGYAFLFPSEHDSVAARQARGNAKQAGAWTLAYDTNDPVARVIAERIALNARDANITLQPTSGNRFDLRLVRLPIASLDAPVALAAMADSLHLPQPKLTGSSTEDLYAAETTLLQSRQVIPLLHLRTSYGIGTNVKNWSEAPDGRWHLSEVWLGVEK